MKSLRHNRHMASEEKSAATACINIDSYITGTGCEKYMLVISGLSPDDLKPVKKKLSKKTDIKCSTDKSTMTVTLPLRDGFNEQDSDAHAMFTRCLKYAVKVCKKFSYEVTDKTSEFIEDMSDDEEDANADVGFDRDISEMDNVVSLKTEEYVTGSGKVKFMLGISGLKEAELKPVSKQIRKKASVKCVISEGRILVPLDPGYDRVGSKANKAYEKYKECTREIISSIDIEYYVDDVDAAIFAEKKAKEEFEKNQREQDEEAVDAERGVTIQADDHNASRRILCISGVAEVHRQKILRAVKRTHGVAGTTDTEKGNLIIICNTDATLTGEVVKTIFRLCEKYGYNDVQKKF